MVKKINARDITLNDLERNFNLHMAEVPDFFSEWYTRAESIVTNPKMADTVR